MSDSKTGFTIKEHNQMQETIDGVIVDINKYNDTDDLELGNAVKSLLEASNRINAYYRKINSPAMKKTDSTSDEEKK